MDIYSPSTDTTIRVNSVEEALWQLIGITDSDFKSAESAAARGMPTPEKLARTTGSPLHALIIGIDHYATPKLKNLSGCVADADAMDEYLRNELQVPRDQIVNLRNEEASRAAILHQFKALRTNEKLRKDDPILIYFAGHGAAANAPESWKVGRNKISLVVPQDCWTVDSNGERIEPIPDRTLGALLHVLAESKDGNGKGDNITVIFDCCHSGSGTRESKSTRLPERGFELDYPVPEDLDKPIWSHVQDRGLAVPTGWAKSGTRSHVFLAACREREKAHEENGRGLFTKALLETLRGVATDKLTYEDLMARIPKIEDQHPQCEGYYVDRVLFNALSPSKGHIVYKVTQSNGRFILDAGSVHGITTGAKFTVYESRDFTANDSPLATMEATSVRAFEAELTTQSTVEDVPMFPADSPCFAFQTSMGQAEAVRLHVPLSDELLPVMDALAKELQSWQSGTHTILLDEKKNADISISKRADGEIAFEVLSPLITAHGIHTLHSTAKPESRFIHSILRGASHFFWHLRRCPRNHPLCEQVDVQVHQLVEDTEAELDDDLNSPLILSGDNLIRSGALDVVADATTYYGVTVHNKSAVSMHVWVFYFDCSDLSIMEYYKPAASGPHADPILPARGSLSIGYGSGGGRPFSYFLRLDQELDVGFIKLFISTEYVDLSSIAQRTPFDGKRADGRDIHERSANPVWDAATIAVVQCKPAAKREARWGGL